jgi:hypothetical protein
MNQTLSLIKSAESRKKIKSPSCTGSFFDTIL